MTAALTSDGTERWRRTYNPSNLSSDIGNDIWVDEAGRLPSGLSSPDPGFAEVWIALNGVSGRGDRVLAGRSGIFRTACSRFHCKIVQSRPTVSYRSSSIFSTAT